jgi:hypothetical protein
VLTVDGRPIQVSDAHSGEDIAIELTAGKHYGGPGK